MAKVYIAGPMSGIPEFNFPAFFRAERLLKEQEYEVVNPADKSAEKDLDPEAYEQGDGAKAIETGFNFREAYRWDTNAVIDCDGIYMLKGWQYSPGAVGEHAVAVAMKRHYPEYEIIYE